MAAGLGSFNQVIWAGVFDADECWIIATYWALVATGVVTREELPTIKEFRAAAGNPDKPGSTPGNNKQVMKALTKLMPEADARFFVGGLGAFTKMLKKGYVASLSVDSGYLPDYLRFNYNDGHQIAVIWQNGSYYVMNPLAAEGSGLLLISGMDLWRAATALLGDQKFHAVLIKKGPDAPVIQPKPPFQQTRALVHQLPDANYLRPYGASEFYDARPHLGSSVLKGD